MSDLLQIRAASLSNIEDYSPTRIGSHEVTTRPSLLEPDEKIAALVSANDSPVGSVKILARAKRRPLNVLTLSPRASQITNAEMDQAYQISTEILGRGSSAVVKVAMHKKTGAKMAVKISHQGFLDEESLKLIQDEYNLLKFVSHPNIVKVHDLFSSGNGCAYLFMELAPGKELKALVKDIGAISEEAMQPIFRQLTSAVSYLHSCRIVHRDVKPDNVIVESDLNRVCLCDFNYCRRLSCGGVLTTRIGDKAFAAPEMLLDISAGEHADLWGLGICLHFALSGGLALTTKMKFLNQADWGNYLMTATPEERCRWIQRIGIPEDSLAADVMYGCLSPASWQRPEACLLLQHPWLTQSTTPKEPTCEVPGARPRRRSLSVSNIQETPSVCSDQDRQASKELQEITSAYVPESAMAQCAERLCQRKFSKKKATMPFEFLKGVGSRRQRAWSARMVRRVENSSSQRLQLQKTKKSLARDIQDYDQRRLKPLVDVPDVVEGLPPALMGYEPVVMGA